MDVDDQPVIGLGGLDGPLLHDTEFEVNVLRGGHPQGGRRAHPVQRLVGAAVGVDQHRPVSLDQQEPGGKGEMGFEPANIINGTSGYDKSHAVHTTASQRHRPG